MQMRRCDEHPAVCGIDHDSDLLRPRRHPVRMSPAGPDARKATGVPCAMPSPRGVSLTSPAVPGNAPAAVSGPTGRRG
jgi:hypothetical protein